MMSVNEMNVVFDILERPDIDLVDKLYDQKTLGNVIRVLVCDYCSHDNFTYDGDVAICIQCGAVRSGTISDEGDYFSHKIVHTQNQKKSKTMYVGGVE
jgi:hypothetical protein